MVVWSPWQSNFQNGQNIPPDEALVTQLLADADYICGLVGKLHITAEDADAGLVAESRSDDGYAYYHWSPKTIPGWRDVYDYTPTNANAHWLLEKGLALPYRAPFFRGSNYVEMGIATEHHQTTWCAEKATSFIEATAGSQRPWLISVNPFAPHHPFDPPPEYLEPYLDGLDEIPLLSYSQVRPSSAEETAIAPVWTRSGPAPKRPVHDSMT